MPILLTLENFTSRDGLIGWHEYVNLRASGVHFRNISGEAIIVGYGNLFCIDSCMLK